MKVRITKCYMVDVIDDDGNVVIYPTHYGTTELATTTEFGTRREALHSGQMLMEYVQKSIKEHEEG